MGSLSSESATFSECVVREGDWAVAGNQPATRLVMQVSAPIEVEFCREGRCQRRAFKPGDLCVRSGPAIASAHWKGWRSILVMDLAGWLLPSVAKAHRVPSASVSSRTGVRDPQIEHLMLALREELRSGCSSGGAYLDTVARAVAIRLLLADGTPRSSARVARGGLARPALRRVIEFVNSNLQQDLPLRVLAEVAGLSPDHFSRAFRESTGETPHRYLLRRKLEQARHLLKDQGRTIAEIAQALGFADQSHLTNLFRRHYGLTPGRLRTDAD